MNILRDFDLDAQAIREAVIGLLSGHVAAQRIRRVPPGIGRRRATPSAGTEQPLSPWAIDIEPNADVLSC